MTTTGQHISDNDNGHVSTDNNGRQRHNTSAATTTQHISNDDDSHTSTDHDDNNTSTDDDDGHTLTDAEDDDHVNCRRQRAPSLFSPPSFVLPFPVPPLPLPPSLFIPFPVPSLSLPSLFPLLYTSPFPFSLPLPSPFPFPSLFPFPLPIPSLSSIHSEAPEGRRRQEWVDLRSTPMMQEDGKTADKLVVQD
ncbi:uncharacterized protein LACBIDRAFT_326610 [Laccaria bicolor S238N-H82]|uniref:Predicted protein n=1 Tax=Laccaria bicolor (strain S238N-H82 / ATCC MYA-4686) TaxID=486041 RepID=B0D975_LACBS|nr:uncharacterized protein LACBIDRAFT_326610 [Laccaria bicolor S238N-H82]EDR09205.1 predicted protein [Laccaria bicolor S238N-H82]|eukprot:XP_001880518.1 predicted protein [Laccaria bicolor S238N-H82]